MSERIQVGGLHVDAGLYWFVNEQALPGTGIESSHFWKAFESIILDLAPKCQTLLDKREAIQNQLDEWYKSHSGVGYDLQSYKTFLRDIGYLVPTGDPFSVETANVDPEIAEIAGPQLVVPVSNARYALNAANARWGSLYDALYGTDAISEEGGAERGTGFNPIRGDRVIAWAREFLDNSAPLDKPWNEVLKFSIINNELQIEFEDGSSGGLVNPDQFSGYSGEPSNPTSILLNKNGLYADVLIDRDHPVGKT